MRIHYTQHVLFEGPAAVADWAAERGYSIAGSHVYRGDPLPCIDAFDMLVSFGGPMSANDEYEHVWIAAEMQRIREAIAAGKAVLGICLGAQLIAKSLGASVYPASEKEIGWFPVRRVDWEGIDFAQTLPAQFTPLHWHGETFDLPEGAVRLAETEVCPNQAFAIGSRVVGLQFHIEATPESVDALVDHAAYEITGGRFQQSPDEIRRSEPRAVRVRPILFALLDHLAAVVDNQRPNCE
jgi:GMP synthase-like glutamine amidotransferase